MAELARGYIASGEFKGNRVAQHIQNQIIKSYCERTNLRYLLSRAEYNMYKESFNQLWAALEEGVTNIVMFSIWQLPSDKDLRKEIYKHCLVNSIRLHFAMEGIVADGKANEIEDIEILIKTCDLLYKNENYEYLAELKTLCSSGIE